MSNVVEMFPDSSGYILTDEKIEGVYNEKLAAWKKDGQVLVGEKSEFGIDNVVAMSVDDLNQFCIMWLAIFNPEVLSED